MSEQLHTRPLIVDMEAAEAECEYAPGRLVRGCEVLLAPGDRVDLVAGLFQSGDELALEELPYSRGMIKAHRLRSATISGPYRPSRASIPSTLRRIQPLAPADATPTRTIHLGGRRSLRRGINFFINDDMRRHAEPVRAGELQIWDIVSETKIDHPFHLHGFFFQLLQVNSSAPRYLSWEDTVNVPDLSRVQIAWLPDDWPGGWMYHCHILEHHAAGMMASFEVLPRLGSVSSHRVSVPGGHNEQIH